MEISVVPHLERRLPAHATPENSPLNVVGGARLGNLIVGIVAIEFFAIAAACYTASVIYFATFHSVWPSTEKYVAAAVFIAVLVVVAAIGFKHYDAVQAQSRDRFMWSGLGAVALAFSLFLSLLFVFKIAEWYSRGTFFFQFVGAAAAILIVRGTVHVYIRRAIASGIVEARRAVLIGEAKDHGTVLDTLGRSGIRWVGILPFPYIHGHTIPGVGAYSRNVQKVVERCRAVRPDDIIFLATPNDLPHIGYVADALSELPVTVHIIPIGASDLWASSKVANFGGTVTIQVLHPPLSQFDLAAKRVMDVTIAGVALTLLSPVLIAIAVGIALDTPGPVIFRQTRQGYNNETIRMFKFRSMTTTEDGYRCTQAVKNDPRVTRIGRILRKTNLDELPQLLNVLRGEMSIVGPRPHPIALNDAFADRISPFSRRHKVKPGITGWAQVNGLRGETDTLDKMQRRVEHDLYYIDNWSFLLDLKIIIMTVFSKHAYSNAF
jgi:Undecaprenyl-phosphate glucose phosphotransferase